MYKPLQVLGETLSQHWMYATSYMPHAVEMMITIPGPVLPINGGLEGRVCENGHKCVKEMSFTFRGN